MGTLLWREQNVFILFFMVSHDNRHIQGYGQLQFSLLARITAAKASNEKRSQPVSFNRALLVRLRL